MNENKVIQSDEVNNQRTNEHRVLCKYLKLAEGRLVSDVGILQENTHNNARVFVRKYGVRRLDEKVGERLERFQREALHLLRHQASHAVVEMSYSVLHRHADSHLFVRQY